MTPLLAAMIPSLISLGGNLISSYGSGASENKELDFSKEKQRMDQALELAKMNQEKEYSNRTLGMKGMDFLISERDKAQKAARTGRFRDLLLNNAVSPAAGGY